MNILNFFRKAFQVRFLEDHLARLTQGRPPDDLICKLVPNPYQYKRHSFRVIDRDGIRLRVDISDYMGHYYFFGFEDFSHATLFSLCQENFVVLDVGANVGFTVLKLAQIAKAGDVIGFEPDPYNFATCSGNLALNSFANASVLNIGAGDKDAVVNLECRVENNRGGNRVAPRSGDVGTPVRIRRLDDVWAEQKLPCVNLIKIDVEGYELKVLKGAVNIIQACRPVLFVEVDDDNLRAHGDSAVSLLRFLMDSGYQFIVNGRNREAITPDLDFTGCHFDLIAQ